MLRFSFIGQLIVFMLIVNTAIAFVVESSLEEFYNENNPKCISEYEQNRLEMDNRNINYKNVSDEYIDFNGLLVEYLNKASRVEKRETLAEVQDNGKNANKFSLMKMLQDGVARNESELEHISRYLKNGGRQPLLSVANVNIPSYKSHLFLVNETLYRTEGPNYNVECYLYQLTKIMPCRDIINLNEDQPN